MWVWWQWGTIGGSGAVVFVCGPVVGVWPTCVLLRSAVRSVVRCWRVACGRVGGDGAIAVDDGAGQGGGDGGHHSGGGHGRRVNIFGQTRPISSLSRWKLVSHSI